MVCAVPGSQDTRGEFGTALQPSQCPPCPQTHDAHTGLTQQCVAAQRWLHSTAVAAQAGEEGGQAGAPAPSDSGGM